MRQVITSTSTSPQARMVVVRFVLLAYDEEFLSYGFDGIRVSLLMMLAIPPLFSLLVVFPGVTLFSFFSLLSFFFVFSI